MTRFLIVTVALGVLGCGADGTGRGKADASSSDATEDVKTGGGVRHGPTEVCLPDGECEDVPAGAVYDSEHQIIYCDGYDECGDNDVWAGNWGALYFVGSRCDLGYCDGYSSTSCAAATTCKSDSDCPGIEKCTLIPQ